MKSISAAEANRHFSSVLRDVAQGERITVTSRGKPVATIVAANQAEGGAQAAAKRALVSRLRAIPANGSRNWSRDDLYE